MNNESRNLKERNKEVLNEEISMEQIAMVMQAFTAVSPTANTISLQQAINLGNPQTKFEIKISVARTSEEEVYYNLIDPSTGKMHPTWNISYIQENLPTTTEAGAPTHTLIGKKSDYKRAISEGKEVLHYFKYVSDAEAKQLGAKPTFDGKGNNITDFLKIGDKVINEKGSLTFDLTDGKDEEIIASGNGLYLLVRTAANNQLELDKSGKFIKMNVVEMKSADVKGGKFKDTDLLTLKTSSDKTTLAKNISMAFELTSEHYNNQLDPKFLSKTDQFIINTWGGGSPIFKDGDVVGNLGSYQDIISGNKFLKAAPNTGVQRDDNAIAVIEGQILLMNDFLRAEGVNFFDVIKGESLKKMSKSDIQSYVNKYKEAKDDSSREAIVREFLEKAMEDYKENFTNFVEAYSKNMGISKEQILDNFDLDSQINKFLGNLKLTKHVTQVTGKTPGDSMPLPTPSKSIEKTETVVKVGETKYQIRNKTNSKNESLKYLRTFEGFRRNLRK